MKTLLALLTLTAPCIGLAQTTPAPTLKVSVSAKGSDVRDILADIFTQAKQPFVIQPNVRFGLYLSLTETEFTKALDIVCRQASLSYEKGSDGIYFVHPAKPVVVPPAPQPTVVTQASRPQTIVQPTKPVTTPPPAEVHRLSEVVFNRHLTTRMQRAPLSDVLESFGEQTKVGIEIADNVPKVKLDAFMIKTSLRYALDKVCKAVNCTYALTDHGTIRVSAKS